MIALALALLTATPATLPATLKRAQPGDTVTLATGDYGAVAIRDMTFTPSLRIEASAARLGALTLRNAKGIEWAGGAISGPPSQYFGVQMALSARVRLVGMTISGPRVGISLTSSTDIDVIGNRLEGLRSDGINLAMVQRVNVIGNQCYDFRPIQPIYDAAGKLVKDGDHADCIQGWSRLGSPPTSDLMITGNVAVGQMQGITFFDPGQGGYDRITIRGNDLNLGLWHGIAVYEGRGIVITGNRVRTTPGAKTTAGRIQPITAWITAPGSTGTICGNVVDALPKGMGTEACVGAAPK